jgi:hypothetical protein
MNNAPAILKLLNIYIVCEPDMIAPEKTGLFCESHRPETFRETAARLEAPREFHPLLIAQRIFEIYREVMAGK